MAIIHYITQIQFDFGAVRLSRSECERAGIRRPLICTDRGIVAAGLLNRLADALGDLPSAVYDGTPSNPTEAAVLQAVAAKVRAVAGVFGCRDGAGLAAAIRALNQRIGLPAGLAAMGITRDTFASTADNALKDHCHATNPRPATREDYLRMLEASA